MKPGSGILGMPQGLGEAACALARRQRQSGTRPKLSSSSPLPLILAIEVARQYDDAGYGTLQTG
uniref:Uncharacterized protein n=1 Tax=Spironucleus salmonicida TaxID=348837 RepID=V6LGY3_9EUKA|eukprot:EST43805.1 Hypothetical protein SS50377_16423 [Spironucleus salmonicida]